MIKNWRMSFSAKINCKVDSILHPLSWQDAGDQKGSVRLEKWDCDHA